MRQAASYIDVKRGVRKYTGPFAYAFPGYHTNAAYGGPGQHESGTFNTAATRLYFSPFVVRGPVTFNRCYTQNSGAGDNTETYRTGLYTNDPTIGPKTLISDFGEVTLTGASALRTQTISVDLSSYVGQFVWLAQHHNTAAAMYGQTASSNLGVSGTTFGFNPLDEMFGTLQLAFSGFDNAYSFRYVDTAYGALASTAVTPTASTNVVPVIRLGKV